MNTITIDVRERDEYAAGHRDGALNIPLSNMMHGDIGGLADTSKDAPIGCYCVSGARSAKAVEILHDHGFTSVSNLGGM